MRDTPIANPIEPVRIGDMGLDQCVELLAEVPAFNGCTSEQLAVIAFTTERRNFDEGERLLTAGQQAEAAFVVLSGEIDERDEVGNLISQGLGAGTMVAETAMLIETVYPSTIAAGTPVQALVLDRAFMARMLSRYPDFKARLSGRLESRLFRMRSRLGMLDELLETELAPDRFGDLKLG